MAIAETNQVEVDLENCSRQQGPLLTVVICTYNRSAHLESCLKSLTGQDADGDRYEVLVVDNNSTDSTAETAAAFATCFAHYRLVREPVQGLSSARNRGWKEARGEYVAYLDDDAVAYPEWISGILRFTARRPEVGIFGGPYDAFAQVPLPGWFPPEYGCLDLGREERPIRLGEEWITGSNMIFKKELFHRVGGFDTKLGMQGKSVAYGEEINLFLQMHESGEAIYYVPSVRVSHLIRQEKMRLRHLLCSSYRVGRNHCRTFKVTRSSCELLLSLTATAVKALLKLLPLGRVPLKRRLYYALSPLSGEVGAVVEYLARFVEVERKGHDEQNP